MIGAIAGDIVGSVYEFDAIKTTEFPLFGPKSTFTDDTVLTLATAFSLLTDGDYAENYRIFGRLYPLAGYGGRFKAWLQGDAGPYNSWGNGSAMRVSPVGFAAASEDEALAEAARSAGVTHDHPEGVKGAQAVALGIYLARQGVAKEDIRLALAERFGYDLSRTVEAIRPCYAFDVSCAGSVPESILCFLEGADWEEAVRLAVSLGGDADTQACIAGGLAQAAGHGLPDEVEAAVRKHLPVHLHEILVDFETRFGGGAVD